MRELIRADEKRKAEEQREAMLMEGLRGAERELKPAGWRALRKEALAQLDTQEPRR